MLPTPPRPPIGLPADEVFPDLDDAVAPATTGPAVTAADETTASHECRNKNGTG